MGAFGVKMPTQYGGLGLSQVNYGRAAMLLGSWDANLTALVSAHQSIGVPQPLLLFGTEEQKKKYLPRVARKEISAFALTETDAGSDPANMSLRAEPTEDGSAFILNGEKLWCTNLIKAGRARGDGEDARRKWSTARSANRSRPSSSMSIRRGSRSPIAATSWGCARFTTGSSNSPTCACRART